MCSGRTPPGKSTVSSGNIARRRAPSVWSGLTGSLFECLRGLPADEDRQLSNLVSSHRLDGLQLGHDRPPTCSSHLAGSGPVGQVASLSLTLRLAPIHAPGPFISREGQHLDSVS